ncbi:MAG: response regulator [Chloroflexota bacterium]
MSGAYLTSTDSRVLILEDSATDAEQFQTALSAAGFSPHLVTDGASALLELETWRPAAILVDLRARGRDGHRFCSALARRADESPLPVVLIGELPNLLKHATVTPAALVSTPVDDEMLVQAVRRAVH